MKYLTILISILFINCIIKDPKLIKSGVEYCESKGMVFLSYSYENSPIFSKNKVYELKCKEFNEIED